MQTRAVWSNMTPLLQPQKNKNLKQMQKARLWTIHWPIGCFPVSQNSANCNHSVSVFGTMLFAMSQHMCFEVCLRALLFFATLQRELFCHCFCLQQVSSVTNPFPLLFAIHHCILKTHLNNWVSLVNFKQQGTDSHVTSIDLWHVVQFLMLIATIKWQTAQDDNVLCHFLHFWNQACQTKDVPSHHVCHMHHACKGLELFVSIVIVC